MGCLLSLLRSPLRDTNRQSTATDSDEELIRQRRLSWVQGKREQHFREFPGKNRAERTGTGHTSAHANPASAKMLPLLEIPVN